MDIGYLSNSTVKRIDALKGGNSSSYTLIGNKQVVFSAPKGAQQGFSYAENLLMMVINATFVVYAIRLSAKKAPNIPIPHITAKE